MSAAAAPRAAVLHPVRTSNTAPLDVSGHPACSVPAPLANEMPCGRMIVGKRFDDATVLRVAHAYEQAGGGFPAPPG